MSNQWPPPQGGGRYGGRPPYGQPPRPGPYGQQPPGPYQQQPPYQQPAPGPYHQQPYGQYPQQQPQQPLFRQQPQPDRGGGGGGAKVLLALGGAGLLVVAMIVGAIVLLGGGGGAGSSPDEALDTFVSGLQDADCDAIEDVTTDTFHDEMNMDSCDSGTFERGIGSGADVEFAAGDVEQDGDKATGTIEIDGADGFDVELVEDGDGWRIDAFSLPMSDAGKL